MGTMSSLMDASRSALANAQTALNITAGNIANQNTVGYARRVAVFTENDTVQIGEVIQGRGATISVKVQRDRVLDQRVQNETQSQSEADARLSVLQSAADIFTINSSGSDGAGVGDAMDALFNSFRSLQSDPTSAVSRQSVLNAAQSFVDAMHRATARLNALQSSMQSQVSDSLKTVNSMTAQLADLNAQISSSDNVVASSLEDQRQQLLTSLSSLIGFNQVAGDNGSVSLTLADGTPLVSGTLSHTLSSSVVDGAVRITSDTGVDVTNNVMGGSIGGALQANNTDIPTIKGELDQLAYNIATAVNMGNHNGLTSTGTTGGDLFSIPANTRGAAESISVTATSPSEIAAASVSEGASGGSNAGALSALSNSTIVSGKTPSAYLAQMLTALGGTVQSATNASTAAADSLAQAISQRDALSGVSLDEEAANLTQYQRSYQAAAKIFAIVNELMANSINLGNDVAVS